MDALPVVEHTDVPFKSTVRTNYNGEEVGVMHACGHDAHTAILMGVAEVLAEHARPDPATCMFIFQPAEEGAPPGEEGGATVMVKEGVFENPKPEVVFGLHVWPRVNTGSIGYRSGPFMAGVADAARSSCTASRPTARAPGTASIPIVIAAQIVNGLQTIVSRQVDITRDRRSSRWAPSTAACATTSFRTAWR